MNTIIANQPSIKVPAPKDFVPFSEEAYQIPVVSHFSRNAEKFPDHPAIVGQQITYSYGELNRVANQLAHEILARRGDKEEPILFLLGKEPSAVVALLGIWKSGRFFVGLDPDNPPSRLAAIVENMGGSVIVCNDAFLSETQRLAKDTMDIINLDNLDAALPTGNPSIQQPMERLAAVFYTSGSTGQPKGVMIDHRFITINSLTSVNTLGRSASDRITLPFSFAFGWGVSPLSAAFVSGGTIYIIDFKTMSSMEIARLLIDQKITITPFATSMFRNFMSSLPEDFEGKFVDIRLLSTGGEAFDPMDIVRWIDRFSPKCILMESLASSEAAVISRAYHSLERLAAGEKPKSPMPFNEVEIFILDDSRKPLPVNQIGQIGIKSPTLMRGYWERPEINSTLFIDDPSGSGDKVFVSTDLGRLDQDGGLEFIGRADGMIKVRGFRVEPGEIETAIRKHHQIKNVVVAGQPKPNSKDEVALVAYMVQGDNDSVTDRDLREFLSTKVPDYMLPSYFVFLDEIPTTTRGKVDRRALPQPDWTGSIGSSEYLAPRNRIEERLVKLWEEILNKDNIGVEDDFTLLGGHSLDAFRLMAKIDAEFDKPLPMQTLIQHPTVASLSRLIQDSQVVPQQNSIVKLREGGQSGSLFLVPGAARTALSLTKMANRLDNSLGVYGLEYPGMDGYLEPLDETEALAAFFVEKILSIDAKKPYYLGGYCFGGVIAYEIGRQLIERGHDIGGVMLLDSSPPGMEDDELDNKDPKYYLGRLGTLLRPENRMVALPFILFRVKRALGLTKRKRQKEMPQEKVGEQPDWVENPLDVDSLKVVDGLRSARRKYSPEPINARGVAFLSSMAIGSPREEWWSALISDFECHYISNTTHSNIFNKEKSVEYMANVINETVSADH